MFLRSRLPISADPTVDIISPMDNTHTADRHHTLRVGPLSATVHFVDSLHYENRKSVNVAKRAGQVSFKLSITPEDMTGGEHGPSLTLRDREGHVHQ